MRVQIVMNIHAGTLRGGDPRQIAGQVVAAFADAGHEVSIEMAGGPQLREGWSLPRSADIDVLVAGRRPGRSRLPPASSRAADRARRPARRHHEHVRPHAAAADGPGGRGEALAHGEVLAVDGATAGGHLFLHQISFGIQPHAIRRREQMRYGSRIEKIIAGLRSLLATLRDRRNSPSRWCSTTRGCCRPRRLPCRTMSMVTTISPTPTGPMAAFSASMPRPRRAGRILPRSAPPWCSGAGRTTPDHRRDRAAGAHRTITASVTAACLPRSMARPSGSTATSRSPSIPKP